MVGTARVGNDVHLTKHPPAVVGVCVIALIVASLLWLYWPGSTLTRQEAIQTALLAPWGARLPANLITGAKLIHRFDLPKVIDQAGSPDAKPFDRVWIVAVKGELVPSTMGGGPRSTYTVEVIRDMRPPRVELYYSAGPGDRPSAWDQVVDLASR